MANGKLRMSNRKFMILWMPAAAFLIVAAIVLQIAATYWEPNLDMALGRGARHISIEEGKEDWDSKYYDTTYESSIVEAKKNSLSVMHDVVGEGITLMKNNGVLPLAKTEKVSPFGCAAAYPTFTSGNVRIDNSWSVKYTDMMWGAITPLEALRNSFGRSNVYLDAFKLQPGTDENAESGYSATGAFTVRNGIGYTQTGPSGGLTNMGTAYPQRTNCGNQYIPELYYYSGGETPAGVYENIGGVTNNTGGATEPSEAEKSAALDRMEESVALVFLMRVGQENSDRSMTASSDSTDRLDGESYAQHYLDITRNEIEMIKWAKQNCKKVIVLLNSSAPMEIDDIMSGEAEADAILWIGHPGENGYSAVAEVLCGDINPSGRLPDIWYKEFLKDQAYYNFGTTAYGSGNLTNGTGNYVEYAEGMYMGYRYYETAHDIEMPGFVYGKLNPDGSIETPGAVNYPFGWGLSYTTFEKNISGWTVNSNEIKVEVTVKNTGSRAGKETVELYRTVPYTSLDIADKVEKPTQMLTAFDKTGLLQPNESETLTMTIKKDELTSYNYTHVNPDESIGCYFLEAGDYKISLRNNSNSQYELDSRTWTNTETIWYDNTNPRQYEKDMQAQLDNAGNVTDTPQKPGASWISATNLFQYMSDYMNDHSKLLTRANWVESHTTTKAGNKKIDAKYANNFRRDSGFRVNDSNPTGATAYSNYADLTNDQRTYPLPRIDNNEGSLIYKDKHPESGAQNGLDVLGMRGKDYYDPDWELLLNQINWGDRETATNANRTRDDRYTIQRIVGAANYYILALDSIGMPSVEHCESANGVRLDSGERYDQNGNTSESMTLTCAMPPLWAGTRNIKLVERLGNALGHEALALGSTKESRIKTGRYAPAFNLHRTPFAGRIFEYFSEDPYLSGKMATAIVNGTSNMGLNDYIKHFGMNDQEGSRTSIFTWATEQVQREIYNRPFEMVIRDARKAVKYTSDDKGNTSVKVMRGCSAMMIAQNKYGNCMGFNNYELCTQLVREEWGFTGAICTDMFTNSGNMVDQMVRVGVDHWLNGQNTRNTFADMETATAQWALREAIHRIAFSIANSNAAQNAPPGSKITYDMSPWKVALLSSVIPVYAVSFGMLVWTGIRIYDDRRHPGKYQKPVKAVD